MIIPREIVISLFLKNEGHYSPLHPSTLSSSGNTFRAFLRLWPGQKVESEAQSARRVRAF